MLIIFNDKTFQKIVDDFTVTDEDLQQIAAAFRFDMEMGLKEEGVSSLKMLKSYIALPSGDENGEFLALDFGGTNVRVLLVRLKGKGEFEVLKKAAKPLIFPGVYDFVSKDAVAEDLFDFIAGMVDEVIAENRDKTYFLGHTFSFPSEQSNLNNARLISWTKEFATRGVEGEVVNDLLNEALKRNGILNVRPVAVINDTVAVLLAGAFKQENTYIGSICATGHNTAYLEPFIGEAMPRMILNLESGGFNKLVPNRYDCLLDLRSEKPNAQRLEKMVSGRYLGELFSLALADGVEAPEKHFVFTAIDLSMILADQSTGLDKVVALMEEKTAATFSVEECEWIKALAEAIVIRSARLVAATYIGIVWHLDQENINRQNIVIDGSLYEKMPMYAEAMKQAFCEIVASDAERISLVLENSGSGIGAAIAAAIGE